MNAQELEELRIKISEMRERRDSLVFKKHLKRSPLTQEEENYLEEYNKLLNLYEEETQGEKAKKNLQELTDLIEESKKKF